MPFSFWDFVSDKLFMVEISIYAYKYNYAFNIWLKLKASDLYYAFYGGPSYTLATVCWIVFPQISYVETITPEPTMCGDRAYKEVKKWWW